MFTFFKEESRKPCVLSPWEELCWFIPGRCFWQDPVKSSREFIVAVNYQAFSGANAFLLLTGENWAFYWDKDLTFSQECVKITWDEDNLNILKHKQEHC